MHADPILIECYGNVSFPETVKLLTTRKTYFNFRVNESHNILFHT